MANENQSKQNELSSVTASGDVKIADAGVRQPEIVVGVGAISPQSQSECSGAGRDSGVRIKPEKISDELWDRWCHLPPVPVQAELLPGFSKRTHDFCIDGDRMASALRHAAIIWGDYQGPIRLRHSNYGLELVPSIDRGCRSLSKADQRRKDKKKAGSDLVGVELNPGPNGKGKKKKAGKGRARSIATGIFNEAKRRISAKAQEQGKAPGRMLYDAAMGFASNVPELAPAVGIVKTVGKSILNFFGLSSGDSLHLGLDGKMRLRSRRVRNLSAGPIEAGSVLMKIALSVGPDGSRTRAMSMLFEKYGINRFQLAIKPTASMTSTGVLGYFYVPDVESKEIDEMSPEQLLQTAPSRPGYQALHVRDRGLINFRLPRGNYYIHDRDDVERLVSPGLVYVVAITPVATTDLPVVEQVVSYTFSGNAAPVVTHALHASAITTVWTPGQFMDMVYNTPVDADGFSFPLSLANHVTVTNALNMGYVTTDTFGFILPPMQRLTFTSQIVDAAFNDSANHAVHMSLWKCEDADAKVMSLGNSTMVQGTVETTYNPTNRMLFDVETTKRTLFLLMLMRGTEFMSDQLHNISNVYVFTVICTCQSTPSEAGTQVMLDGVARSVGQRRGGVDLNQYMADVRKAAPERKLAGAANSAASAAIASATGQNFQLPSTPLLRTVARTKLRAGVDLIGVEPNPGPRGRAKPRKKPLRTQPQQTPKQKNRTRAGCDAPLCKPHWVKLPLTNQPKTAGLMPPSGDDDAPQPNGGSGSGSNSDELDCKHTQVILPQPIQQVTSQPAVVASPASQDAGGRGVCRQFQKTGKCKYGNKGKFSHVAIAAQSAPSIKGTCKEWAQLGRCRYGDKCKFEHGPRDELLKSMVTKGTTGVTKLDDVVTAKLDGLAKSLDQVAIRLKVDASNDYDHAVRFGTGIYSSKPVFCNTICCPKCKMPCASANGIARCQHCKVAPPFNAINVVGLPSCVCPTCHQKCDHDDDGRGWCFRCLKGDFEPEIAPGQLGQCSVVGEVVSQEFTNIKPKRGFFSFVSSKVKQVVRAVKRFVTSSPFPQPAPIHTWSTQCVEIEHPKVPATGIQEDPTHESTILDVRQTSNLACKLRRPYDDQLTPYVIKTAYDAYSKCSSTVVRVHRVLAADLIARFGMVMPETSVFDAAYDVAIKALNVNTYAAPELRETTRCFVRDYAMSCVNGRKEAGLDFA